MIWVEMDQNSHIENTETNKEICDRMVVLHVRSKDKIFIRYMSENEVEEIRDQVYYDASNELDES